MPEQREPRVPVGGNVLGQYPVWTVADAPAAHTTNAYTASTQPGCAFQVLG